MVGKLAPLPLLVIACAMVGCSEQNPALASLFGGEQNAGRVKLLGSVEEPVAFEAAKDVLRQYFEIATVNADTQTITTRPKDVQEYKERLLGASPTRQVARLEIFRTEGQTAARISVSIQQLGGPIYRSSVTNETYSGVPNQTPAEVEGATTVEQNQTWKHINYAYDVERKILDDIYRRLHPETKE